MPAFLIVASAIFAAFAAAFFEIAGGKYNHRLAPSWVYRSAGSCLMVMALSTAYLAGGVQ